MNQIRTINDVIRGLGPNDARIDWWGRIRRFIETKRFCLVWELLQSHSDDIDYDEQVLIISAEIVRRLNEDVTMNAVNSGKMVESDA